MTMGVNSTHPKKIHVAFTVKTYSGATGSDLGQLCSLDSNMVNMFGEWDVWSDKY